MNIRQTNRNNLSSIHHRPLTSLGHKDPLFSSLSSSSSSLKRFSSPLHQTQSTQATVPSYKSKQPSRAYYPTPIRGYPKRIESNNSNGLNMSISQPCIFNSNLVHEKNHKNEYNDYGKRFNYSRNSNFKN